MRSTTSTSPRRRRSSCAEQAHLDRTFLAVDFDGAFLDEVAALAHRLRGAPRLSAARWTKPEMMHTTVRFFGDTSDAQQARLSALVNELAEGAAPLPVVVTGVHGFPQPDRAHVLVLDIADGGPSSQLAALAARAEEVAVALGFAREERPYHAHLTLARMRKAVDVSALGAEAASLPSGKVTALTLYASRSGPEGASYTALARAAWPAA